MTDCSDNSKGKTVKWSLSSFGNALVDLEVHPVGFLLLEVLHLHLAELHTFLCAFEVDESVLLPQRPSDDFATVLVFFFDFFFAFTFTFAFVFANRVAFAQTFLAQFVFGELGFLRRFLLVGAFLVSFSVGVTRIVNIFDFIFPLFFFLIIVIHLLLKALGFGPWALNKLTFMSATVLNFHHQVSSVSKTECFWKYSLKNLNFLLCFHFFIDFSDINFLVNFSN